MKATHPRVSYADLERWPDDGRRYELYDGEVYVVPSPLPVHQIVLGRLYIALHQYSTEHGGLVLVAPLDIVLTDYDVVQPDVLFFTADRAGAVRPRQVTREEPDLAIEILSPSTAGNDRGRKMPLLARHGVREYWLVDPDVETIEIYRFTGDRYVLASKTAGEERVDSPLLPHLALIANSIFPDVDHLS